MKPRSLVDVALLLCALLVVAMVGRREFAPRGATAMPSIQMRMVDSTSWSQVASGGHLLYGSANAPVRIVEFGDFQCGACATASAEIRALHERNPELVAIAYRHYPLQAIHRYAYTAAVASECAAEQGAFLSYYNALFEHYSQLDDASWAKLANIVQLADTARFRSCLGSGVAHRAVVQDTLLAYHLGVRGTPTFIVNRRFLLRNPATPEQWDSFVQEIAQEKRAIVAPDSK